ncbi:hypothetical protein J2X36_003576 [Methylobacterium sp. BE186]|uniref:ThiF family adenylyltransferase n=1 Tax=Methylobacterium sp. BE186 TaxID=2817715 RepID=UPI0028606CB8|nr:ThiF family adenylyltransferase [Methylobacterium sp. BE186]MDR7038805.1 hypothetical protein [Methylobacterium sp. BE186]
MTWFIERPDRFVAERRAVAALAGEVDWLPAYDFVLDGRDRLLLRFTVLAGGAPIQLELRYPRFYPDAPPEVVPVDPSLRLADHQWAGGSLCLEHRADNWRPEVTGAVMIRSAHTLLSAEAESAGGARALPAVHDLTLGQLLRGDNFRHLYSTELIELLQGSAPSTPMMATMRYRSQAETIVSWIDTVDAPGGQWRQPGFPEGGRAIRGVVMWVPNGASAERLLDRTASDLPRRLAELCRVSQEGLDDARFVFAASSDWPRMVWRVLGDGQELIPVTPLRIGDRGMWRAATNPAALPGKRAAIVGCGSAGSKIATTLARAGVGGFLLIDDDVLMRGNLVRNDLDWNGVGEHKVHALGTRLKLINPDVAVTGRPIRLVGQEASSSVDTALEALAGCDVIVDATANADAFNLLSAVATRSRRPLVWLEVFEGGLGGMVARHRPHVDAPPQDMRSVYLSWCRDHNAPWTGVEAGDYASREADGHVLVADDAEVGVIANHAARFALDTLAEGNTFPYPMYVIALRARWIFREPFEVLPIRIPLGETDEGAALTEEALTAAIEFLDELLAKRADEDPAP